MLATVTSLLTLLVGRRAVIQARLPPGREVAIPYDVSSHIQASINEVVMSLLLAVIKVIVIDLPVSCGRIEPDMTVNR